MSAAGPSQGARPPGGEGRAAPSGGDTPSAAGPSQGARPPGGEGRAAPSGGDTPSAAPTGAKPSGRRTLIVLALVTMAPILASYGAYYLFPRDAQANYGELLPTRPAPEIAGAALDGAPFRVAGLSGKWVLALAAGGACDAACQQQLYATRQARAIQGKSMDRVVRVWLVTDDAPPPPALLAQHPDVVAARVAPDALAAWGRGGDRIYVVDPLGNLVLAFPRDPDVKAMAKDLTRLLKASRIG